MAARFSRWTGYFGGLQGTIVQPAMDRVAEEEKQGTMIVPSDPSGRSSPVAAGEVRPFSGWAGKCFLIFFNGLSRLRGMPGKMPAGFSKFGCASV